MNNDRLNIPKEYQKEKIKSKIKYDSKLNQRIKSVVQRYNAKISRLEKKGTEAPLPSKIKVKDLKTQNEESKYFSYTKRDLNQKLKEMENFLQRGSEKVVTTKAGVKFTEWEYKKLQKQRTQAIRRINKRIEELESTPVKFGGVSEGLTYAQMGNQTYLNYKEKLEYLKTHRLNTLKGENLETYLKNIKTVSKPYNDAKWKRDFLDIHLKSAYTFGIDVSDITEKLMNLTVPQFTKAFNEERLLKELLNPYALVKEKDTDFYELKAQYEVIIEAIKDNIDNIIKNAKS